MARREGLRVRLKRIPGETPKSVLRRPLYLPAALGTIGWTEEASHSEYDTVRAGQFSQPAQGPASARQLRSFDDVETLFVSWKPRWLVDPGVSANRLHDVLYGVLRSRRPVELLAWPRVGPRPHKPLVRMHVTFRSISRQLREGEPDTIYYTVRLVEWRPPKAERLGEGKARDKLPTTHRLTEKDTLHSLAMRYYHSARYADNIAAANAIHGFGKKTPLVKHRRFKVGSKIKIPKIKLAGLPSPRRDVPTSLRHPAGERRR